MVIYQGPSMLDGAPIVALATGDSRNRKTGRMIQTWIMRADLSPVEASHVGADGSVCGAGEHACPQRQSLDGACYVTLHNAPRSAWEAWRLGRYDSPERVQTIRQEIDLGAPIRLGSYGDPAAVPIEAWDALLAGSHGWTGYTHQWRRDVAAPYRALLMASCDSARDVSDAQAMGWRTFHALAPGDSHVAGSIECLADARGVTCAECGACDGARIGRARQPASVWIHAHGSLVGRYARRAPGLQVIQ